MSEEDTISWNADVQVEGEYQAQVYYTCSEGDPGIVLKPSCSESALTKEAVVPMPRLSAIPDRSPRSSASLVKDFAPLDRSSIGLKREKRLLVFSSEKNSGQTNNRIAAYHTQSHFDIE